jgi:hypothetical protein
MGPSPSGAPETAAPETTRRRACRFPSSISSLWNYCSKRPRRNRRGLRLKWREGDPTLSSRDAAPVCLGGRVLGAARHPWIWALSKLALFTAGGIQCFEIRRGNRPAARWVRAVGRLSIMAGLLVPPHFPLRQSGSGPTEGAGQPRE